MNILSHHKRFVLVVMVAFGTLTSSAWAEIPTGFTNIGSVANTRRNMTQQPVGGVVMNGSRNDYNEVCVYCHTPHGANSTVAAPLWNRTIKATTYNSLSLTQPVSQPGNNSLICLSCHDGQMAIDSIINMSGSGRYLASQTTSQNVVFLNSWNNSGGALDTAYHRGINSTDSAAGGYQLGNGTGSDGIGCMACHSPEGWLACGPSGLCVAEGNDMRVMNLGTDLRNDHPVGVTFPAVNGMGTDFNTPAGVKGSSLYFRYEWRQQNG